MVASTVGTISTGCGYIAIMNIVGTYNGMSTIGTVSVSVANLLL